jgi:hypothetical protein
MLGKGVMFNGVNLRSANWGEKVSGMGIVEEIYKFGVHDVVNIRVKDRKYDKRFIFDKLLEDTDLITVMLVCVEEI